MAAYQNGNGGLNDALIDEVTFNGEPIDFYEQWELGNFDAQAAVTIENGVATLTATATYNGYESTVVYTANTICEFNGG